MFNKTDFLEKADVALEAGAAPQRDQGEVVMKLLTPGDLDAVGGADGYSQGGSYYQFGGYLMTFPSPPFPGPSGH